MSGYGYRSKSELTESQAWTLRWSRRHSPIQPADGNARRTIRSLVNKGYMRWTLPEEMEAAITDEGRKVAELTTVKSSAERHMRRR